MRSVLIVILLLFSIVSHAAAAQFKVTLSHKQVVVGQRFQLSYTINQNGSNFTPPRFDGFRILSGPNSYNSTQIINGNINRTLTISYVLVAEKEGTYEIPPAKITIEGKVLQTAKSQIKVSKANPNGAAAQQQKRQKSKQEGAQLSDYVFIKGTIDKQSAYVGEQIILTYKFYTRLDIRNTHQDDFQNISGFWSHELVSFMKDNIRLKQEYYNGEYYKTAVVEKLILIPQKSGKLTIEPFKINTTAIIPRRGYWGESRDMTVSSLPIEIDVKPLPKANQPSTFNGAVGNFKASFTANKTEVNANDAIDVKITINGKGNLPLIVSPKIEFPPDFESYDPETESKFSYSDQGAIGNKIFKYLVIPRHAGDFKIEPFAFTYFDVKSESYKTIRTSDLQFKVGRGSEEEGLVYTKNRKQDIETIGSDIRYIHVNDIVLISSTDLFYGSSTFYLSVILFIILASILWFFAKKRKESEKDTIGTRKSKANKLAKKRLSQAKKYMDANETVSFYESISEAMFGYYSDKFNLERAELSQERIIEAVQKEGLTSVAEKLKEVLEAAQMARFAPSAAVPPQQLYESAIDLISKTENPKAA